MKMVALTSKGRSISLPEMGKGEKIPSRPGCSAAVKRKPLVRRITAPHEKKVVLAPYVGGTEAFASPEIQHLVKHLAPDTTREQWTRFCRRPDNLLTPARSDNWGWALTVFIMFTGRKIWHRSSTKMAEQVDAHLSHPLSDAIEIPFQSPAYWEKHIHDHLQKRLFTDSKDDRVCSQYAERIGKRIKESPKEMLWLLQQKHFKFKGLGIKMGHRAKFKQMMHSILHPAPKALITILKKTLSEKEGKRYMTMAEIVHDLVHEVPRIQRLVAQNGRLEKDHYLQSSRRSTLHRFLGCGLLNKGYLREALTSFADAGNWNFQTTVELCISCWIQNDRQTLRKHSLDNPVWTKNIRPTNHPRPGCRPGMLKRTAAAGGNTLLPDHLWKASSDGEKTLRDRLRECKASENSFYLLVNKAELMCVEPQQASTKQGLLSRILVVGTPLHFQHPLNCFSYRVALLHVSLVFDYVPTYRLSLSLSLPGFPNSTTAVYCAICCNQLHSRRFYELGGIEVLVKIMKHQIERAQASSSFSINSSSSNLSQHELDIRNVMSLCCAMLSLHMYCMDLDEVWHEYCQTLVKDNHIIELVAKTLRLFTGNELIQENLISVLWRLTDFGFRYTSDMKSHHIQPRIKAALHHFADNKAIKEKGQGILNWFSDTSPCRSSQRPSINYLQLQLSLLK
jgi:hypothetical protein